MADYQNPYLMQQNPYLQQTIDQAQGDLVRNYNLTTQPAYNTAMVKSGSFGNQGVQQMNENAQRNLQGSLGDISTQLRGQDYQNQQNMYRWDQGFNRDIYNDAYAQNLGNAQFGVGLLGTLNSYNQQDLSNATTIKNTPLDYWGQFNGAANSAGFALPSTTNTQGSSSSPVAGALGGAQLGNAFTKWWNNQGSANNYGGSSNNSSAANYTNQMDQGYTW